MKAKKLILFLSLAMIPGLSMAQTLLPDSIIKQLKTGVEGFKNRYNSPSIAVVIVHGNEIIFSDALGYTDISNKVPATIHSKYPIQSVTKLFTATLYMQLVQQGKIGLNDDILRYVPEYRNADRLADEPTTLLQLATHTSGLPRNSPADIQFTKQIDTWMLTSTTYEAIQSAEKQEFLKSLRYVKTEYPTYHLLSPGDRHYSNLGYALLGTALERATKGEYEQRVIADICRPLKMTDTGFGTASTGKIQVAKGYYYDETTSQFRETPEYKPNSILYAGGMYSTAEDLARFISFQFNDHSNTDVLSPQNKRMMQYFGIGWKNAYPFILHEGSILGSRSEIVINPEMKIGWAILTNTTDFEFGKMNDYISRLIVPRYSQKPVTDLSKYVGTYVLEGGYDSLKIYLKEGKLYSSYLQGTLPEQALTLTGNNRFQGQGRNKYKVGYEFLASSEGEITTLNLGQLMWVKQ